MGFMQGLMVFLRGSSQPAPVAAKLAHHKLSESEKMVEPEPESRLLYRIQPPEPTPTSTGRAWPLKAASSPGL
ncbi:hypothetical protein PG993_012348 [Apiospora rasikravindrae]|uniref:Uncharacterized protein n=1 Tax=Apiospora rasikravindrae TaxID=990691 RepID=A0ABR1S259_9PEZI